MTTCYLPEVSISYLNISVSLQVISDALNYQLRNAIYVLNINELMLRSPLDEFIYHYFRFNYDFVIGFTDVLLDDLNEIVEIIFLI